MTKVLVLGARGLLGKYIAAHLSKKMDIRLFLQSRHKVDGYFLSDPVNASSLNKLLDDVSPDVIINLVALTDVDECERDLERAYLVNTKVVENAVTWIFRNKPETYFLQISTDHFYSGANCNKESCAKIINTYALSKYAAELALSGTENALIVRTNFFGKSLTDGRASFSDWLFRSLKSKKEIKLADDIFFNPLSLNYLAKLIIDAVTINLKGVFNFGSRDGMSKFEFGLHFADLMGLDAGLIIRSNLEDLKFKVSRPADMRMSLYEIEKHMGVMPTLKYLMKEVADDYK